MHGYSDCWRKLSIYLYKFKIIQNQKIKSLMQYKCAYFLEKYLSYFFEY